MSNIAARQEVRDLVRALDLPAVVRRRLMRLQACLNGARRRRDHPGGSDDPGGARPRRRRRAAGPAPNALHVHPRDAARPRDRSPPPTSPRPSRRSARRCRGCRSASAPAPGSRPAACARHAPMRGWTRRCPTIVSVNVHEPERRGDRRADAGARHRHRGRALDRVADARRFVASTRLPRYSLRVLVEMTPADPGTPARDEAEAVPSTSSQGGHHGSDPAARLGRAASGRWCEMAAERGFATRVGLEDG